MENNPIDIVEQFQNMQKKNDMAEVLKELFDSGKIYMISDLTKDEIRLMTRIHLIAKMKDIPLWHEGLRFYSKLILSRDRRSRKELIDAIAGMNQNRGFLSRLNLRNWGRGGMM